MALKRMDNVGIVVDDIEESIDVFRELGLEFEGRTMIEGEWAGRVTGLGDQRVEIAMMRTPDGHTGSSSPASSSRRQPLRITAMPR
jgi:catechol 2,3-dioxygenase-like lactoylglutathione lyase family enzyme